MKAVAVIGANYGDEGKGLMVDYLARSQAVRGQLPIVIRFNGGAQAGHTVVTPDGKRHVFGHVGAGAFVGAVTVLSSRFIVNPFVLRKELLALKSLNVEPLIYAHPSAELTTMYDMAINSLAELARGKQRHGSCGMGINETVTRSLEGFSIRISQVKTQSIDALSALIQGIAQHWVPKRLEMLGLDEHDLGKHELYAEVLRSTDYRRQAEALKELSNPIQLLTKAERDALLAKLEPEQELILEGAQGLALDEQLGAFPHVTRSVTGLVAAAAVAAYEFNAQAITPIYMTRSYLTRHGAGPLAREGELITDRELVDTTNVDNQWQGSLRMAPLDLVQLKTLISADLERARLSQGLAALNGSESHPRGLLVEKARLALTCIDQLGREVSLTTSTGPITAPSEELSTVIACELGRDVILSYTSSGPTAATVRAV